MSVKSVELNNGKMMPLIGAGMYLIQGQELVERTLNAVLKSGYRLIDTASVYKNEKEIGVALHKLLPHYKLDRKDIFLTSKLGPGDMEQTLCETSLRKSLKSLQTEYLDLYLIHWPGVQGRKPDDPNNKRLRRQCWLQLEQFYKQGLVKAIGVSNYSLDHMKDLLTYCTVKPAVLQIEFHPQMYQAQVGMLNFCLENGIHLQAYSSLGTSGSDQLKSDPVVNDVARKHNKTVSQVLLRWAVQQNIGVIPKSTNQAHIDGNMKIWDFELDEKSMNQMKKLKHHKRYCWDPNTVA